MQALEWGANYLFKSCAKVDIGGTAPDAACQGCSGQGTCGANGACTCNSSAETGFFYGSHCQYENECAVDADCGANGACVDVGDVSGPALQVPPPLPNPRRRHPSSPCPHRPLQNCVMPMHVPPLCFRSVMRCMARVLWPGPSVPPARCACVTTEPCVVQARAFLVSEDTCLLHTVRECS